MTTAPEPGMVLDGKFRLDRLLGEGGMGSVWAATNLTTRKAVALKLLKADATPSALRRFVREARLASLVQHPNLVAVHDVIWTSEGVPTMVMDLLDGETLRARLVREQRVPLAELCVLLLPVVGALRVAHEAGIVHRDLKPENLFLHRDHAARVKLVVLDFGIAKRVMSEEQDASAQLTGTGDILGTFQYMAPEQLFGETDITPAADVWALGVLLHECVCGERPLGGGSFAQLLREAVLKGQLPALEHTLADQPSDVRALISSALSIMPAERPTLERFETVLGRHARAPSSGSVASLEAPADPDETLRTPSGVESPERTRIPPEQVKTPHAPSRSLLRGRLLLAAVVLVSGAGLATGLRKALAPAVVAHLGSLPGDTASQVKRDASTNAAPASAFALSVPSTQGAELSDPTPPAPKASAPATRDAPSNQGRQRGRKPNRPTTPKEFNDNPKDFDPVREAPF